MPANKPDEIDAFSMKETLILHILYICSGFAA